MADNEINILLSVDDGGLKTGFSDAASAVEANAQSIASSLGDMATTSAASVTRLGDTLAKVPAAGAADAVAAVTGMSGSMTRSIGSVGQVLSGLTGKLGTYGQAAKTAFDVGDKVLAQVEDVATLAESIENLSAKTGISVARLSGWRYAAEQMGVSAGTVDAALVNLGRSVQEAIDKPAGDAARAFDEMGIKADQLKASSNDLTPIVRQMADAFHSHLSVTQQDSIALTLMKSAGDGMITVLQLGGDKVEQLTARQRELGSQMTGPMAAALAEHRRAVADLDNVWTALWLKVANTIAPALSSAIHRLVDTKAETAFSAVEAHIASLQQRIDDINAHKDDTNIFERFSHVGLNASRSLEAAQRELDQYWQKWQQYHAAMTAEEKQAEAALAADDKLPAPPKQAPAAPPPATPAAVPSAPGGTPAAAQAGSAPGAASQDASAQIDQLKTELAQLQGEYTALQRSLVASSQATARQMVAATTEAATQGVAVDARANQQQEADDQSSVRTKIELGKLEVAAKKNALDEQVIDHQITAARKIEIEKSLVDQEYALDIKAVEDQQRGLDQQSGAYKRFADQIRILRAKLANEQAALDRQAAQEARKSAEQEAQSWREAIGEITGAEDTFIRDVLTKRQSMSKSLEQMSAQLVLKEISDDARYYTTKLLYSLLGLQAEEKAATGGLLVHLLTEQKKTAATAAGTTTRNALDASGETSFLGRVATQLAQWLGLETSKTAATATGDGTRQAADIAAAAAGRAVAVSTGMGQISIDAAVAAAGTMAAISAIPYIGPFLAPEMAAAAYATTMGFAAGMGGVALEVGAWEIPGTMAATLHSGEMVVPATFASGLRAMVGGAGSAATGAGTTLSPSFNISAVDAKSVIALFNNPNIMRQIARNLSGYMAMNPSVRGAY